MKNNTITILYPSKNTAGAVFEYYIDADTDDHDHASVYKI